MNMTLPSCLGIHGDIVAPYLVHLTTEEQKERWLPRFCSGELLTAIGMTEPSGGSDLAALKTTAVTRRRRVGDQRLEDLHHQRLLRRPHRRRGAHRAREEGPRHHAVRRRERPRGLRPRPQARQGRPGRVRHGRAVVHRRPRPARERHRRGRRGLHPHDDVPAAGAARLRGHQPRPRRADPHRDDPVRQGPPGLRQADRLVPAQPVPARRARHARRGHPGVRRPVRARAPRRRADRRRRRQGEVVDRRRCRTTCSTTACRSTAATGS